ACVGVIFTEAVSHARVYSERFNLKGLTNAACSSTYSFAMARALALGALPEGGDRITDAWESARAAAKQPPLPLSSRQLRDAWDTLAALKGADQGLFGPQLGREPREIVTSA